MIISEKTAKKHILAGNATLNDCSVFLGGRHFAILTRYDKNRVDHVEMSWADEPRHLAEKMGVKLDLVDA